MNTIFNLKLKVTKLFVLLLLLPSFGGAGGGLYAQDPELFEHTWYLQKINVNDQEYLLDDYYTGEISVTDFNEDNFTMYSSLCEFVCFWFNTAFDSELDLMNLSDYDECVLTGECTESSSELYIFKDIYFSIFYFWDNVNQNGTYNNPFTYSIEPISDYLQLTIENGEGDWAIYNSVLLSTPTFHQNSFTIFPNPVKENLTINNTSSQSVSAIIYDVTGKLLQSHTLEANTLTINVKTLNAGLYFVVFENELGEKVSKKFVKSPS